MTDEEQDDDEEDEEAEKDVKDQVCMCSGSEEGSDLRLIDVCITQL